jgi:hypothetical protein
MIITPTNVTVIEAVTTNKFQLDFINDNPKDKTIIAQVYPLDSVNESVIQGQVRFLTLWEGQEYDNIGNWTQQQANDRIIELLTD